MKKTFITGFLGIAFAFVMAACNGNNVAEDTTATDTCAAMEQTEECCMQHCQATCPDSVCLAANCENCTCPDSSACRQKPACCKGKAEGEGCQASKEGCKGHEGCKSHEGCKGQEGCKGNEGCKGHKGCPREAQNK